MKTPHKYAEMIKQWADGAKVEYRFNSNDFWRQCDYPSWVDHYEYRIKPEPQEDIVFEYLLYVEDLNSQIKTLGGSRFKDPNCRLTFDAETGKLKSAEVL